MEMRTHYENTLRLKNVIQESCYILQYHCPLYMHHMVLLTVLDTPRIIHTPTHAKKHTHYMHVSSYETGGKREREKRSVVPQPIYVMHVSVQ